MTLAEFLTEIEKINGRTKKEILDNGFSLVPQVENGTCAFIATNERVNLIVIKHEDIFYIDFDSGILIDKKIAKI